MHHNRQPQPPPVEGLGDPLGKYTTVLNYPRHSLKPPAFPMAELTDGADLSIRKPESCTIEHCYYAFDTLYCALTKEDPVDIDYFQEYLKGEFPLFVTWNTVSSRSLGGVRLRGCIGNFEAMSLDDGIKEYALIRWGIYGQPSPYDCIGSRDLRFSAFRDHRFRPIEEKELRKLEYFEDAGSYLDWEVGTHGIYITLQLPIIPTSSDTPSAPSPISSSTSLPRPSGRQRRLTATYLPDVIPAQGWTKQEAVDSALRKAGFDGRITEEVRRAVKLRRYQSSICSARWEEYWAWRQGATGHNRDKPCTHLGYIGPYDHLQQNPGSRQLMSNPEQLFNSLRLEVIVPNEVIEFPESIDSAWIRKLEALGERPARLQFYLVSRVGSKPAGGPGPTPPLYLLNFLVYLQVAIDAIYVPSYTPASGGTSPRPPAKLRLPQGSGSMLNIPAHSSPLKNPVNASRPVPVQPPETPNPQPMTSESERILGRTDMGVPVQSYFWGEENDGQRKIGVQDEYLRVRMQDPVLCLTVSATLRDKPMLQTPQREELIELFKSAGGVYQVVKSRPKHNGSVPPKDQEIEDDVMYGLEEVNLLEGLTDGITFTPEDPADKLTLSTSRMGTGIRRQAFSLAPTPSRQEATSPASVGTTTATPLSNRQLPTLRKAFRKTLPTASGIQVRLLPAFVPHAFTDDDFAEYDETTGEEHSVVLSIELENSGGQDSGFLVEKIQVTVNGEDTQTRLLGSTKFPLPLRSRDQYNLLYAVMFMLPPDLLDAASGRTRSRRDSIPVTRDSFMHRIVTIIVTGRPFDLTRHDMSSQDLQELGMRTKPFDARWHCPLDLFAMSQQSAARSNRPQSMVDPVSVDPSRDIYPVPPSPFPSVMSQRRNTGTPHSSGHPFTGPFSGSSMTPDGSSFSSVFGGPVELPSATVAGSKRHTIAGLASLAAKRASLPTSISQRASTPVTVPPTGLTRPGAPPKFMPMPPSVAVSAGLTPPHGANSFTQSQMQGTPTKGSPTASSHSSLAVPSSGPTPVTPAFPAYPDAPLPSSPLSQAPMQGLMASVAPPLEPPARRDSLSRQDPQSRRDSLSDPLGLGQRHAYAPSVLQPVLVSVSLLPPDGSSDERIYPMNTFSLEIFVFNESDVVRRCEISCPARKRWRQETAQRSQDVSVPDLIAYSPLRPGTCQSVRMRFLAIQPGSHSVDTLTLTDVATGFAINLRDTMNVVVHKREEAVSQVVTPAAEIPVTV
ncbi:AMMECR1 domain-containing protein [Rhizoctonia solani AG-1 IA]|uniref:AMMECR1 domain-containing protein n=1 Tax=Thanatephorus cucumeris (strain AG1-IA) TaxID=983506 RepID=L8WYQ1_THACA|nr:AMMECR1 domain-containing protein [Rhizoctonia solani AG-1 IA]